MSGSSQVPKRRRNRPLCASAIAFVKEYAANGHNAMAAFRSSRDCSRMKPLTIKTNAHRILKNPKAQALLAELEAQATALLAEQTAITLEGQSTKLNAIYVKALAAGNYSAAIAALEAQNKIHGLNTRERENDRASSLKERLEEIKASRKARQASDAPNVVKLQRRA